MPSTTTSHEAAFHDAFESSEDRKALASTKAKHLLDDGSELVERPAKKVCSPSRRISCKARGLSSAHNKETAFFTIPVNAPHGLIVNCSHQECFGTGRSFRYCKICDCPVAKRNFLKRHGHGIIHTTAQLKEEVDDKHCWYPPPPVAVTECYPVASSDLTTPSQQGRRHSRIISFDGQNQNLFENLFVEEKRSCLKLSDDEKSWLHLLRERPPLENDVAMSKWLSRVLEHSELQKQKTSDVIPEKSGTPNPFNEVCHSINPVPLDITERHKMLDTHRAIKVEPEGLFDGLDFSTMFD